MADEQLQQFQQVKPGATVAPDSAKLPAPQPAPAALPQPPARPLSDLGSTTERYQREIAQFSSVGLEVQPAAVVMITQTDPVYPRSEIQTAGARLFLHRIETVTAGDPIQHLLSTRGADRDVLPPLARSTDPVRAPVYQMKLETDTGAGPKKNDSIVISDLLLGKTVATIPANAFTRDGESRGQADALLKTAAEALKSYDKANHQLHLDTIAKLPHLPPDSVAVISLQAGKKLPEAALSALRLALPNGEVMKIGTAANGKMIDTLSGKSFTADTIPAAPMIVRGPITEISFSFNVDGRKETARADRVRYEKGPGGQTLEIQEYVLPGETSKGYYFIRPPLPLLGKGDDPAKLFPVPISLGPLGQKTQLDGVIFQTGIAPQTNLGSLAIYSTIEPELFRSVIEPRLRDVKSGAGRAELLFGVPSGSLCGSVFIAPTKTEGAYYSARDSKTIVIPPNSLETPAQARSAAFHETIHLIDRATKYVMSDALNSTFRGLRPGRDAFIESINESNFVPGAGPHAGHARDNTGELLATVMTSTFSNPQWKARAEELPLDALKEYKAVIGAIKMGAGKIDPKIADGEPIIKQLERVEKELGALIKQAIEDK